MVRMHRFLRVRRAREMRRRRRPRALIRRLRRAKVVLADDELRLNGRGGAEDAFQVCEVPCSRAESAPRPPSSRLSPSTVFSRPSRARTPPDTRRRPRASPRSTRPPSSPPSASSRTRTATSDIRDMLRIPGESRVRPTSYSGRSRRGFLRLSCELRFKRYRSNSMRLNLPVREVKVIRGFAPLLRDPTGHIMMRSARAAPRCVVRVQVTTSYEFRCAAGPRPPARDSWRASRG